MKSIPAFLFVVLYILTIGCSLSSPALEVHLQFASQRFSPADIEIAKAILDAIAKKYHLHLVPTMSPEDIRQYSEAAMGKTKGLYKEEFTKGSMVRIADRSFLENFFQTWKLHNKLEPEQITYADQVAEVESVGFYHGGDELYRLKGVPGVWHEQCLEAAI